MPPPDGRWFEYASAALFSRHPLGAEYSSDPGELNTRNTVIVCAPGKKHWRMASIRRLFTLNFDKGGRSEIFYSHQNRMKSGE